MATEPNRGDSGDLHRFGLSATFDSSLIAVTTLESRNPSTTTARLSQNDRKVAFAALKHAGFGWFFVTTMLAMSGK
mgnify:FL=1